MLAVGSVEAEFVGEVVTEEDGQAASEGQVLHHPPHRTALVAANRDELDHVVAGLQAVTGTAAHVAVGEGAHIAGGVRRAAPVQSQADTLVFHQHAGVAMGRAGSDLALETADAVVVRDELRAIPAVVRLSRAARRLVVQNLVIAGVCIAVLVVWDLVGHLPLPLGVAGHEGSTVLVGLNGLRLLREGAWGRAAGA